MAVKSKDVLINLAKFPMIIAGLWPRPLFKSPFLNKIMYAYSIFARTNYFIFYFFLVVELLRLIIQGYTLQIILSSFSVVVNATKIAVKTIIYIKNNVLELCEDVIDREEEIWRQNDPEILKLYLNKAQTGKLFRILITVSTILAVLGLNLVGAYSNLQLIKYNKAHNASLESHHMYQFWFPVNKLDHLNWVNFFGFTSSYAGMTYNITTHMVLITLLMYSASQLVLLQHRLKNYIPDNFQEEQMDETITKLKEFIMEHQYLIRYTESINDRCKNIIMMEFILSSFDVASVTTTIIKLEFSDLAWLIVFFCLLVIQIFCLAWSCNEIHVESEAVADAAFESRWQLLNKDGKQLTQLLMQRAQQRPLMMTIGPFGPMTTASFLMVMKAAYSYLSIMG